MSMPWAFGLVWLTCATMSGLAMDAEEVCSQRKTCKGIEYDVHEAVCCKNQLHPGTGLSCCGELPYDPAVTTCCTAGHGSTLNVTVELGLSEKVSACCGLRVYNPLNEMCCHSTVIVKPVPKARCCGEKAFDEDKQLCCGPIQNKKILTRASDHHQCCGHGQYDTTTHCCCWADNVLQIQRIHSSCCVEDSAVILQSPRENVAALSTLNANNPLKNVCSHSTVAHAPKTQYCGKEAFDVDKQLCCGPVHDRIILLRKSNHHQCCNRNQYDTGTECCCWINEIPSIQLLNASCCANEAGALPQNPVPLPNCTEPHTSICGSTCYNPSEFHCCERNQTKPFWCCSPGQCDAAPTVYNPHTQLCCDGCVSERTPWIHKCCGHTPYGLAQRSDLCCNSTLYKDRDDEEECSDIGIPYNPAKGTMCCTQFHGSPGQHCCGAEIYQPHTEICCHGHRQPKVEYSHCCGIQVYNIRDTEIKCCAGTLYNLTSLGKRTHEVQCCGATLQKPQDVCCSSEDKEFLYTSKKGFRCCGHLYYNTSLWLCCAGKLGPVHQPSHHQDKNIIESRFLSLNNLNKTDLCKEMKIGTVESISLHSIVFSNVLKICGVHAVVKPLHSPYILKTPDRCSSPKLITGKTYFFGEDNVFTDFNHDSLLQSLHFIISKCYLA